ncbi:MAG: fatty acid desaturase [Acidimicrobiia bacterium]|nr:fatty acid desaturase [Acidimicrobiia bacterium]
MTTAEISSHDELVASMTGGMVPTTPKVFNGTDKLRADGRPRPDFRAELRNIDNVRNAITFLSVLAAPALITYLVLWAGTWWAVALAVLPMGMVQTRMAILHHEGSHRLLFSKRSINDLLGVTFIGWLPFGTGTHHYRRGHANHHRDEFGPKEPDFLLYAFYPITRSSMRRKLLRDLFGVSAYRIVKPRFTGLVKPKYLSLSLRFFAGQVFVAALFWLAGSLSLYVWLWLLPYFSWYQLQNRLRAIAEHGGMTRSPDRRDTTHHVEQSWLPSLLIAPYYVGYHVAHHVDSGVPMRNLPRLHAALVDGGYIQEGSVWPSYRALWSALMSPASAKA